MLRLARRAFRRFFPRRLHPLLDATGVDVARDAEFEAAYRATISADDAFTTNRYREGVRWRHVVEHYLPDERRARVLDVGGGNGAIELAFDASPRFVAASVEQLVNRDAMESHRRADTPLRRSLADAAALPFRTASIDVVLLLETIEHLREPMHVGAEIARVTRDGGVLLITTPLRWRYAFSPDPHFGIRGLVLLPPSLQRAVAARRGYTEVDHYVDRIYASATQVARCFPDFDVVEILSRSRAPRAWFWDALVLRRRAR
ncbi:MAG TPA: class I SAM-dependent methyltransferase [Thermoanaerobaculia bacterium]|nr:class I SAM-dependent methyltransferase [Thermoanaerobaculia bacterium]